MGRGRLRPWDLAIMQELIKVARGIEPADLFFTGGEIIDVYNGKVVKANLATKNQRIAYVGTSDRMVGSHTQIIDLKGKLLAPGYIEPHAHPFQLFNPLAYAENVLTWGTVCSVNDDLIFMNLMSPDNIIAMVETLRFHPVKMLWSARLDPQTFSQEAQFKFTGEAVSRLIKHPLFVQVGELTDWPSLINDNEKMQSWLLEAERLGKKAEGHAPGASGNTLNPLSAVGVTACHEAIKAEDVIQRLRLGMYSILRYSSIRPDLPELLEELMQYQPLAWERMMMTTDGPTPSYFGNGFNDRLIKIAIEKGVPPVTAYQLVTRNPAVYLGLDQEIGGLAPGRLADMLILNSLEEPTPRQVFTDGRLTVARKEDVRDGDGMTVHYSKPVIDWQSLGLQPLASPRVIQSGWDWLLPGNDHNPTFPVMKLVDSVISRQRDIPIGNGLITPRADKLVIGKESGLCYAALITRDYQRITHGILDGFATHLDGMASSFTTSFDLLTIGQDPTSMHHALKRVEELGGGIAVVQGGEIVAEVALPLGGSMSDKSLRDLIKDTTRIEEVLYEAGYPYRDLFYTLLFISATHLPEIRLTKEGIMSVKNRNLLRVSENLGELK